MDKKFLKKFEEEQRRVAALLGVDPDRFARPVKLGDVKQPPEFLEIEERMKHDTRTKEEIQAECNQMIAEEEAKGYRLWM